MSQFVIYSENSGACVVEHPIDDDMGESDALAEVMMEYSEASYASTIEDAVAASVYVLQQQQARTIRADVKSEGSTYNVRLYDHHGVELPAFVYEARYDGVTMQHDTAISKAYAVRDYLNSLAPSTRNALYLLEA